MSARSLRLWPTLAALVALAGCGWRSEGVHMDFFALTALPAGAQVDASGLHWTAADSAEWTITQGWVVVSAVEIAPCTESTALRRIWNELGYGTAHAHTVSRPTRIGAPTVVAAVQEAGARTSLGVMHPPATSFCKVRVTFEPADEDAAGLPAEVDMVGKVLWLDGVRSAPPAAPAPFHLESSGLREVELQVGPWSLDEDAPARAVALALSPARWLEGVDLASPDAAASALTAVAAAAQVE